MVEFNDIFRILQRELSDSLAISAPYPVIASNKLYDVFFTYFVDNKNRVVEPPEGCLAVYYDEERVVDIGDAFGFSALKITNLEFAHIDGFRDALIESRKLYGDVRIEIATKKQGEAVRQYSKLIKLISQPCLLPYYEAMGMEFNH